LSKGGDLKTDPIRKMKFYAVKTEESSKNQVTAASQKDLNRELAQPGSLFYAI
jgi:hypothetical protein